MWATRYPILFVPSASFSCRLTRRICPLPRTRNVSPSKNTRARGESSVERNRARRLLTYLAVALGDPRVPVKRIMCFPLICQGRFVFPLSFFFFLLFYRAGVSLLAITRWPVSRFLRIISLRSRWLP